MKKTATKKTGQDIPVLKREQLGVGVRGKCFKRFMQGRKIKQEQTPYVIENAP